MRALRSAGQSIDPSPSCAAQSIAARRSAVDRVTPDGSDGRAMLALPQDGACDDQRNRSGQTLSHHRCAARTSTDRTIRRLGAPSARRACGGASAAHPTPRPRPAIALATSSPVRPDGAILLSDRSRNRLNGENGPMHAGERVPMEKLLRLMSAAAIAPGKTARGPAVHESLLFARESQHDPFQHQPYLTDHPSAKKYSVDRANHCARGCGVMLTAQIEHAERYPGRCPGRFPGPAATAADRRSVRYAGAW